MDTSEEYIKLYKQIVDWEWYRDMVVKSVFIHLLLTASVEPCRRLGHELRRGETVVVRKAFSEACGVSEKAMRTAFAKLLQTGEIQCEKMPGNRGLKVLIVNYDKYQNYSQPVKDEKGADVSKEVYLRYINQ